MLQRKYRLKKYSAFIATYKKNNAISDENVCIYFGKEKQSDEIYQAWKHLSKDSDLEVYKVRQFKTGCITVTVKVKQTNGES